MSQLRYFVVLAAVAATLVPATPAWAIKQFKKGFAEHYKLDINKIGCNACHVAEKSKKHLSPYGTETAKLLKKKDFGAEGLTGEAATAAVRAALEKIDGIKAADGKTYGDHIRGQTLPGLNDPEEKKDE